MYKALLEEGQSLANELSQWRQHLHSIPELGLTLPKTIEFVKSKLDEMGVNYTVHEDSSTIIALIGSGGKCFMLRSDMDALPMKEETDESFASQNGCMHSCGHDLHTTILLGAAKLLKNNEDKLQGTVKLLFQSGEEVFTGAKAAIEAGVLENPKVEAGFAMHVASNIANNIIVYGPYPMASVYGFKIILTGKGAHGSTPHLGIDPINTGVHIYLALQEILAREVSATEEAALTIGVFNGGTAANIIPERITLEGTLRTFNPEITEVLISRINEVVHSVAKTYRTTATIQTLSKVPSVSCDNALTSEALKSITGLDSNIKLFPLYHVMGSEDFAFFTEKIPCSYLCLGSGVENKEKWVGQHNPKVVFNEKCLPLGAAIYAKVAMDWLFIHK